MLKIKMPQWVTGLTFLFMPMAHASIEDGLGACKSAIVKDYNFLKYDKQALLYYLETYSSDSSNESNSKTAMEALIPELGSYNYSNDQRQYILESIKQNKKIFISESASMSYLSSVLGNNSATAFSNCIKELSNSAYLYLSLESQDKKFATFKISFKGEDDANGYYEMFVTTNPDIPTTSNFSKSKYDIKKNLVGNGYSDMDASKVKSIGEVPRKWKNKKANFTFTIPKDDREGVTTTVNIVVYYKGAPKISTSLDVPPKIEVPKPTITKEWKENQPSLVAKHCNGPEDKNPGVPMIYHVSRYTDGTGAMGFFDEVSITNLKTTGDAAGITGVKSFIAENKQTAGAFPYCQSNRNGNEAEVSANVSVHLVTIKY